MKAVALRAALLFAIPFLAACDDGAGPDGESSNIEVQVYVETDETIGMGETDQPISAVVTLASNFDDLVLVDSTGVDGRITFTDIPAGAYTVTHALVGALPGADLQGNASQTVVAPFAGDDVITRFVYLFEPGSVTGVVFRDDNGSGGFEAGQDSVFEGVEVLLFEGGDTIGTPIATDESDEDGLYDLGDAPSGDYTLLVRPPAETAIVGANPRAITVAPGQATFEPIQLTGDPTGPVITIAAARATAVGDTVKVRGTVTAGQGTYRDDSFYVQDSTSGIFVFGLDSARALVPGDSVQIVAARWVFREEAFLTVVSVVELGTGELPAPRTITTTDLNAGLFQGELATLTATVDSFTTGDGGVEVWVHDASGVAQVFVDNDTDIPPTEFTEDAVQTFIGVLGTFDQDDDHVIEAGDYRLQPREPEDVQ